MEIPNPPKRPKHITLKNSDIFLIIKMLTNRINDPTQLPNYLSSLISHIRRKMKDYPDKSEHMISVLDPELEQLYLNEIDCYHKEIYFDIGEALDKIKNLEGFLDENRAKELRLEYFIREIARLKTA
jgi:hypothetical protein